MPIPLSVCSIALRGHPLDQIVRLVADAGFDGLEIMGRPPHLDPDAGPDSAHRVREMVRASGLEVIAYGSYLGTEQRHSKRHAATDVATAEVLGARILRVWASCRSSFEATVEFLRAVSDRAASSGVVVVVERHSGSYVDTADRAERLVRAVDRENFGLNYQPLDALPMAAVDAQPADARRLATSSRYAHLKNYLPPDEPADRLRPWGSLTTGALDYEMILGALVESGYRAPMSIEFLSVDDRPVVEKLSDDLRYVRSILSHRLADPPPSGP